MASVRANKAGKGLAKREAMAVEGEMVRRSLGGMQKVEWPSVKIKLVYDDVTEVALNLLAGYEL
jgi:hypothetical protein